jgi:DNA-binding transcriptional regulator YiaG
MFHYEDCGLTIIWLTNGYTQYEINNNSLTLIEDPQGLHRLIAKALICRRCALAGDALGFLRREMTLSQSELGDRMDVHPIWVNRWEQTATALPRRADIALRTLYMSSLLARSEEELHVHLVAESECFLLEEQLIFTFGCGRWQRDAPPLPGPTHPPLEI